MTTGHDDPPPNLADWVRMYGGYPNIPWLSWDRAVTEWQTRRRERLEQECAASKRIISAQRKAS
jgi:hypothetical protein